MRASIDRDWFETAAPLVPMPGSVAGHADHADRLARVLGAACLGYAADIRALLMQVENIAADHEAKIRQTVHQLRAVLHVDEALAQPVRRYLPLFDDVLTSGRHFKVGQALLRERFPEARIIGLFLARSLPTRRILPATL